MTERLTWTIGAGGLIGSAVARSSKRPYAGMRVSWGDPSQALSVLRSCLDGFTEQAGFGPWAIVWAAGAATVAASPEQAQSEADLFERFAESVAAAPLPADGVVLMVSSAGGIHAGSQHPPFTESTPPAPISPYGHARLAQERAATTLIGPRWPVVIARVSNVYGPGQDLTKMQGLISRIALCSLRREPLNVFVPISTVRDYIYVADVANRVHEWIEFEAGGAPGARVRLIASGEGTSIGQLIRTAQDVGHRRVPVAMGTHPSASAQAPDLRFIPSTTGRGVTHASTPLPVGMKNVFDDVLQRLEHAVP